MTADRKLAVLKVIVMALELPSFRKNSNLEGLACQFGKLFAVKPAEVQEILGYNLRNLCEEIREGAEPKRQQ